MHNCKADGSSCATTAMASTSLQAVKYDAQLQNTLFQLCLHYRFLTICCRVVCVRSGLPIVVIELQQAARQEKQPS